MPTYKHNILLFALVLAMTGCAGEAGTPSGLPYDDENVGATSDGSSNTSNSSTSKPGGEEDIVGAAAAALCEEQDIICPEGPQGAPGAQGAVGPQGTPGTAGPAGLQGTAGPTGPAGSTGPQGGRGPTGLTGERGPRGLNGTNGSNGSDGADGTNGTDGKNGSFDVSALYAVGSGQTPPTGSFYTLARCDDGDVVLTGACTAAAAPNPSYLNSSNPHNYSGDAPDRPDSWGCSWTVRSAGYVHSAIAYCIDLTP